MSQPSSSIVSVDNAEMKYKKALKEISKLISANRVLRESGDKSNNELKEKIDELSLRYEDLEKEYDIVVKEKQTLSQYLDEIQKERAIFQRENVYLNDCFVEQKNELQKLKLYADSKGITELIRTYEEKEASLKLGREQGEKTVIKLKGTIESLENEIEELRISASDNEEREMNLKIELSKYKEMNDILMTQNQRLIAESNQKDSFCIDKEREIQSLIQELNVQVSLLKQKNITSNDKNDYYHIEKYEQILSEKNRLEMDMKKMQEAYEEGFKLEKDLLEMEEREKIANIRAERAIEELNMLKNKIVVMEAKDFLDQAGDDDYDQKEFQERLNLILSQNDPLESLKNGEDNSHFRILKSFIVDLQDKIYKINSEGKALKKKYRSLKKNWAKTAEQMKFYEDQNKLMKGKMEGYERLSEKLHFELEKSVMTNEEDIVRITHQVNNILKIKNEEYSSTISVMKSQLEMTQDKGERTEKNLKQEIQTQKLQLEALKIKYKAEAQTFNNESNIIEIYKKKNNDINQMIATLNDELADLNERNSFLEEQLKEEKGKNEGLVSQKQQLISQNKQLTEELDRKVYQFSENSKTKEESFEYESKRYKNDNTRLKEELQYMAREMKNMKRELQEKRNSDQMQVEEIKRLNTKNMELEDRVTDLKKKIREIHEENDTLKIKAKKFQDNYEKYNKLEDELIEKTDQVNDLLRDKLVLENDLRSLQAYLNDEKKINGELQKEISSSKLKSLESSHDIKKQFENKLLEGKKTIQSLNQDISDLTSELREEKSKNLRLNNEVNMIRSEKNRLQEVMDQNRKKDFQAENQLGNLKLQLSSASMEIERLKNDLKSEQASSTVLNQEIETIQQKVYSLNQQISGLKMKLETNQEEKSDIVRDLNSLKYHYGIVDGHLLKLKSVINQSWDQQNFTNSLTDMITKIRKIGRSYGISFDGQNNITDSQGSAGNRSSFSKDQYSYYKSYAAQDVSASGVKPVNSRVLSSGMPNISMDLRGGGETYLQRSNYAQSSNFDQAIGTTESIRNTSNVDYIYSTSNMSTLKGIETQNQPSYNYLPNRGTSENEINFDFSSGRNLGGSNYINAGQVI